MSLVVIEGVQDGNEVHNEDEMMDGVEDFVRNHMSEVARAANDQQREQDGIPLRIEW